MTSWAPQSQPETNFIEFPRTSSVMERISIVILEQPSVPGCQGFQVFNPMDEGKKGSEDTCFNSSKAPSDSQDQSRDTRSA